MAVEVGHRVTYHSEHGDLTAWVTDYEPGRDQGDYRIAGFNNAAAEAAGQGPTFARWSVVGDEQGAFSA